MANVNGPLTFVDQRGERAVPADRFLAVIVESSDDAIIGKTLDGIITSWNQGAKHLYGYTPEEATGQHISLIISTDRPDELPAIMERLRNGQRINHYETLRVRKDGVRCHISVSISPIRADRGHIVGAVSIGRDITERVQVAGAGGYAARQYVTTWSSVAATGQNRRCRRMPWRGTRHAQACRRSGERGTHRGETSCNRGLFATR